MTYNLNGKNIRIPDAEIDKNSRLLGITREEAIQMYLEDEGYVENEQTAYVEELTKKAKEAKISHDAKSEKPRKQTKRERKPDEEKENLIEILANALVAEGFEAKVTNKSKIIEFSVGSNHYKLDLIRQRPPKE
jgi:hypothetical protein